MGEITHIAWTDHTFNPWEGCTKVSPGCLHCYAETRNQRFSAGANWGKGAPRRRTSVSNWNLPLRWNREHAVEILKGAERWSALCDGSTCPPIPRPRVFCASLADWLDDEVPVEWLADLLRLVAKTPNLDWQLLTKRPENWKARLESVCEVDGDSIAWTWLRGSAPANIWVGTTAEDQTRADERIPQLLEIPARVRFLSCEPLLTSVDLSKWFCSDVPWKPTPDLTKYTDASGDEMYRRGIHWVIAGGESGPGARPMHPAWAEWLLIQCKNACVPFFFKQWGEWLPIDQPWTQDNPPTHNKDTERFLNDEGGHGYHGDDVWRMRRGNKITNGNQLDGVTYEEFPS